MPLEGVNIELVLYYMETISLYSLCVVVGYFIGAVSFAVIVAKRRGVDILKEGSGNPGATNVKRVMGKKAGNTVFLLDFLKGVTATGWPILAFAGMGDPFYFGLAGLVGSVLGHSYSVFLKFKGGKGVATTMGGVLVLMPTALLIGGVLWGLVFYAFRYVSLASIVFGLSLPIAAYYLEGAQETSILGIAIAVFIIVRHKVNIKRLFAGTENRFGKK